MEWLMRALILFWLSFADSSRPLPRKIAVMRMRWRA